MFKFKYIVLVTTLLLGIHNYCLSQDSTYIAKFSQDFSTRIYFADKFTALNYEDASAKEFEYRPNSPVSIGLGISWRNTSLSFGYGFNFMRNMKKGKTRSLDFQYHYYGRKVVLDLFFQKYKGFFIEDEKDKDAITLYPDIKIRQYGIYGQYVFNGNKFSYQAAFNQSERQLKSVGTILLGGGIYYNRLENDSTLILNGKNKLKNLQIGVSGGYAYTFVFKKRYFASLSMTVGLHAGYESLDRIGKDKIEISPTMFPRFSMGYQHNNWSAAITAVNNRVYVLYSEKSKLGFDTGAIQVTFVKRFDTLPVLSKLVKRFE